MDTKATKRDVSEQISEIKRFMPETYKSILAKVALSGNFAYEVVRRGLRGEAGCFYARERICEPGRLERWVVAGTPAGMADMLPGIVHYELSIGVSHVFVLDVTKPPAGA